MASFINNRFTLSRRVNVDVGSRFTYLTTHQQLYVEPRLAAGIIVAAYFAIVTEWVRCEGKFDLAEAVQQSLDIILNGLATHTEKK